jgi:hypothetical protein
MICMNRSSPKFSSNFNMSYCNLESMVDHRRSWRMGLFFKHEKYGKSNVAKKGNNVLANEYWVHDEASCDLHGP